MNLSAEEKVVLHVVEVSQKVNADDDVSYNRSKTCLMHAEEQMRRKIPPPLASGDGVHVICQAVLKSGYLESFEQLKEVHNEGGHITVGAPNLGGEG